MSIFKRHIERFYNPIFTFAVHNLSILADVAPIIIKRITKGGHAHHGGAWKVAYADFVTAMMAFFLLLWLISASTQDQRSGLADYFTPTQGLKDAIGIGTNGGVTVTDEGERRDNKSN